MFKFPTKFVFWLVSVHFFHNKRTSLAVPKGRLVAGDPPNFLLTVLLRVVSLEREFYE